MITSSFVPNSTIPKQDKINKIPSDTKYQVYFSGTIEDYTGSASITDSRIKGLNNDYFYEKGYSSEYNNMKIIAYLLDIKEWNKNYTNTIYAEYAIGGPTIEILLKSYNQKYGTVYEYQASSKYGYSIRKVSTDSWSRYVLNMFDTSDSLYICEIGGIKAGGMWLSSPTNGTESGVMSVGYNGKLQECGYGLHTQACRPVVCLKSDVKLQASGGGYILK